MVGHTGVMEAAVKAVEALDHCVEQVAKAQEAVRKEAFLFFFLRRERRTYSVVAITGPAI
jgi:hypothetical protein